jgi:SNF2 family DNA or RNA helicase
MIINTQRRAVILSPREAEHVPKCIPHATPINYKGVELLVVPHKLDETKVLRNLGVPVRSPILDYYNWPRNKSIVKAPFEAQYTTAAFLSLNWRAHTHNGLGSGKTLAALWAWDYLRSIGSAQRLLIVSTLSTIDPVWRQSVETHFPHLRVTTLHGTKDRRRKLLALPADVYIINHDGVAVILDELRQRDDIDAVIIDEIADAARNAQTDRWRALDSLVNAAIYQLSSDDVMRRKPGPHKRKPIVWGLTATPIPNAPTDAYAQAKLVTPEKAPHSFQAFKRQTMIQRSQFVWVPKPDAIAQVHNILTPAIRFSTAECVDLPPTSYLERDVALTKEQSAAYKTMARDLVLQTKDGKITAANEGVKLSKLLQIACGFGYSLDGGVIYFDATPRLNETLSLIRQSESKAIVFVPFIEAVGIVADFLSKQGLTVARVYGDVPARERTQIFADFQTIDDPHVLVCQPEVMAHGLTLTAASMSIWYAPYLKASIYEQANGRTPRPGQKLHTNIANIGGTPIERRIYDRLKNKASVQGVLLDLIREGRDV